MFLLELMQSLRRMSRTMQLLSEHLNGLLSKKMNESILEDR